MSIYDHKTDNYHVSGTETSLRQPALDALNQMLDAFYVATGHQDMIVISGYRTTQQQQELYDADLAETGGQTSTRVALPDTANTKAAMPWTSPCTPTGCSTTMTAPGNMPGSTRIVRTTAMYCAMQRTSRRPPASRQEPWHYRYVGQPHATYMMENNVCLEEYHYTAEKLHRR